MNRPPYHSLPVADALRADWRGWHLSQKMDGIFAVHELNGCTVMGEQMKDGSFHPFDIVTAFNQDVRRCSWNERSAALNQIMDVAPVHWHRIPTGHGAEFIEAVLAKGGEGIVAKAFDSPLGAIWTKCKRLETYDCTIAELNPYKASVRVELEGQNCGWVPVHLHFDALRPGMVIEVRAACRHASGKLREARFIRIRTDKGAQV